MPTRAEIETWFTYQGTPNAGQVERYRAIREKAKELAVLIVELTPCNPDQDAAVRKVREAVMTANAAIACDGR